MKNYTDFSGSSFEMMTGHAYPRSCCKSIQTVACDGHNVSTDIIHQEVTGDFAGHRLDRPRGLGTVIEMAYFQGPQQKGLGERESSSPGVFNSFRPHGLEELGLPFPLPRWGN